MKTEPRVIICSLMALGLSAGPLLAATNAEVSKEATKPAPASTQAQSAVKPTEAKVQIPLQTGVAEAKPAASAPEIMSGKAVEVLEAAGYTYLLLDQGSSKKWVAVPAAEVTVGQQIQVRPGMEMGKFTSKTLNRTFEQIIFSAGLVSPEPAKTEPAQPKLPAGHAPTGKAASQHGMPAMGPVKAKGDVLAGKVTETMESGGYTYICLEKDGVKTWAAVPTMKVKVGEKVELLGGNVMNNFTSKSLNRTFEKIVFSAGRAE